MGNDKAASKPLLGPMKNEKMANRKWKIDSCNYQITIAGLLHFLQNPIRFVESDTCGLL